MNGNSDNKSNPTDVIECARAVEDAIRNLCRATIERPSMAPADIDIVLSHLAEAAAALPQAAAQLSDLLSRAQRHRTLVMDTISDIDDPGLAIDAARLHLDAVRQPALQLYRHLDAAHQHIAHVGTAGHSTTPPGSTAWRPTPTGRRVERCEPPQTRTDERGRGVSR